MSQQKPLPSSTKPSSSAVNTLSTRVSGTAVRGVGGALDSAPPAAGGSGAATNSETAQPHHPSPIAPAGADRRMPRSAHTASTSGAAAASANRPALLSASPGQPASKRVVAAPPHSHVDALSPSMMEEHSVLRRGAHPAAPQQTNVAFGRTVQNERSTHHTTADAVPQRSRTPPQPLPPQPGPSGSKALKSPPPPAGKSSVTSRSKDGTSAAVARNKARVVTIQESSGDMASGSRPSSQKGGSARDAPGARRLHRSSGGKSDGASTASDSSRAGGAISSRSSIPSHDTTTTELRMPVDYDTSSDGDDVGLTGTGMLVERFLVVTGGVRRRTNAALDTVGCFDTVAQRWLPYLTVSGNASAEASMLPRRCDYSCALPQSLYGHCCVTHGHRYVWLVGGLCCGLASRTILRLSFDVLYSPVTQPTGTSGASTSSSSMATPPLPLSFTMTQPPILNASPGLGVESSVQLQNHGPVRDGYDGLSRGTAIGFCVVSCKVYHIGFPVGLASCVKLQGALNPVAIILGGLSTVRDTDCGDVVGRADIAYRGGDVAAGGQRDHAVGVQCSPESANANTSGAASSANNDTQDSRRLGFTNRVFALNLADCSIFRVAQYGCVPSPRILASAAPVVRRDASGSYGSIVYFGGVFASQCHGKGSQTDTTSEKRSKAPCAADEEGVYVASVAHEVKTKSFSLTWRRFCRRSEADCWPPAMAGHHLCAMPGCTVLLSGPTLDVANTESPPSTAFALIYDGSTGVTWSEISLVRDVVAADAAAGTIAPSNFGMLQVVARGRGSVTSTRISDPALQEAEDDCCLFVVGGNPFVVAVRPPKTIPLSPSPQEDPDVAMEVRIEILPQRSASQSAASYAVRWDCTVDRKKFCIDEIVRVIVSKIMGDDALRSHLPKHIFPVGRKDGDAALVENNLLLYGRGTEGERVPLSNDYVLQRMMSRCGICALPIVACVIPPIRQYIKRARLGKGSFGCVYAALNEETGQFFAVKEVRYDPSQRESLLREIRLLRSLDHPNIVKYLGVELKESRHIANIFLEYVKMEGCNDLTSLLRNLGTPSMSIIRSYLVQVLAALTYLHSYNIVHQDIKGANVLVGTDVAKLADFGTARQLVPVASPDSAAATPRLGDLGAAAQEEVDSASVTPRFSERSSKAAQSCDSACNRREAREGTIVFMAPEVLLGTHDEMTTASDIWSLGCLLIEMASGALPWKSQLARGGEPQSTHEAMMRISDMLKRGERPAYPSRSDFPPSGISFLDDCLMHDPHLRKTAAQLMQHPFITDEVTMDHRSPSPLSVTPGAQFSFGGRQLSEVMDSLEGMMETFVEMPPAAVKQSNGIPAVLAIGRRRK